MSARNTAPSIFYADDAQKRIAEAYIAQLNRRMRFPARSSRASIRSRAFIAAEDYHQDYLVHNPTNPYIVGNDLPKVENLKRSFPTLYVDRPVLAMARNYDPAPAAPWPRAFR